MRKEEKMTKKEFYDFAIMMKENSNILFQSERNHTSIYLAGYVLEAYIKIILIHHGESAFEGHLGDNIFLNKFRRLNSLYPDFFSNSILEESNINYPKKLFNGGGNNTTKASWKIKHRYNTDCWTDNNFTNGIQLEIEKIKEALERLRIEGVIEC